MRLRLAWVLALVVVVAIGLWLLLREAEVLQPPPPLQASSVTQDRLPPPAASVRVPPADQIVQSTSGIDIHLHRRAPVVLPKPPYGAAFAQLLPLAQAGDATAQYRLGLLLYECRDVSSDAGALQRDIESVYQTRRRKGWEVDNPEAEVKSMRRNYEDCREVPAEDRARDREWLKKAADAGLIEAELALPLKLPPGEYCQYLAECAPVQRARQEALQAEAIDYTGRARDAGSAAALWTFGGWYAQGEVLDANDVEAYAHFRALDEINLAAGQPQRFVKMLEGLRARLRPADMITAEARADALLSNPNCCVLTP